MQTLSKYVSTTADEISASEETNRKRGNNKFRHIQVSI